MLTIKPNCEYCDVDLGPDSADARVCSYECTFCVSCVDNHLHNVCPNCGGGFVPRPIRPQTSRRQGVGLEHQPASTERVHLKWSKTQIAEFVATVKEISPQTR